MTYCFISSSASSDIHYVNIIFPRSAGPISTKLGTRPVSYTHLRAHETSLHLVCRLLLEKRSVVCEGGSYGFLMIRRPPRSTHCISSAASDVYKRQLQNHWANFNQTWHKACLLYTSPSPRDLSTSRMPSSA